MRKQRLVVREALSGVVTYQKRGKRERKSTWRLETSIWAPRLKECDAKALLNHPRLLKRMLKADLKLLNGVPRFRHLLRKMSGNDERVPLRTVEDAFAGALARLYVPMVTAIEYYAVMDTNDDPFDMSLNAFLRLCHEAKLLDDQFTLEVAQRVFVQVNVEIKGQVDSKVASVNDDNSLMRHEMIEAVLRIADYKYELEHRHGHQVSQGGTINLAALQAPLDRLRAEHLDRLALTSERNEFAERLLPARLCPLVGNAGLRRAPRRQARDVAPGFEVHGLRRVVPLDAEPRPLA